MALLADLFMLKPFQPMSCGMQAKACSILSSVDPTEVRACSGSEGRELMGHRRSESQVRWSCAHWLAGPSELNIFVGRFGRARRM